MRIDPKDLEKTTLAPGDQRFLRVFIALIGALLTVEILRDFTPAKSAIFFFLLAWPPLLVLHELGHAGMARLFGWHVHEIVIGYGRVVKRWQRGPMQIELRALPLGGHVVPVPQRRQGARLASFFIYAAGPGIELAFVGGVAAVLGVDVLTTATDHYGLIAIQAVCVAALVGAVTNLLPMTTAEGAWTDGKGMLMSPFLADADLDRMMASPQLVEGNRQLARGDEVGALATFEAGIAQFPEVVLMHYGRAVALVALGRRLEALMNLQTAASDPTRSEAFRAQAAHLLQHVRETK